MKNCNEQCVILGIDIGTTNISAVLLDVEQNKVLVTNTVANDSKLHTESDISEYDAQWIINQAKKIIDSYIKSYPNIKSIGITGQMHGIVYVGQNGEVVSPLYNWQDNRGNRIFLKEKTYCQEIFERTGYTVFSGYGFATLFYNKQNAIEPEKAISFCSIMDYVAMSLCGNISPVIHPTNAASFGLYDIQNNRFDSKAINQLGLSHIVMPKIAGDGEILGYYQNIPVGIAIGDNQASFYGSVRGESNKALVNFGTGSQISVVLDNINTYDDSLEIRPYLFGKYLLCGSALCGGKAYSVLEKFFAKYAAAITNVVSSQYDIMNDLAQQAYLNRSRLTVSTQFCGTRKEPSLRGAITEISDENFTPENMILGVLQGMVDELKLYFDRMNLKTITGLIASGNAVKKNTILQMLLKDTFNLNVCLLEQDEEAAIGAALYAAVSNSVI